MASIAKDPSKVQGARPPESLISSHPDEAAGPPLAPPTQNYPRPNRSRIRQDLKYLAFLLSPMSFPQALVQGWPKPTVGATLPLLLRCPCSRLCLKPSLLAKRRWLRILLLPLRRRPSARQRPQPSNRYIHSRQSFRATPFRLTLLSKRSLLLHNP